MSQIVPKHPNQKMDLKDINHVLDLKDYNLIPTISKEAIPHNKIKKEDFEKISIHILSLYLKCQNKLDELYKILPEIKVKNLGEFWKKYNKKNDFTDPKNYPNKQESKK